jgi:hypothetical protein
LWWHGISLSLPFFFVEAKPPAFFLRKERRQRGSWLVDLLPVGDACDVHGFRGVFDGIDDAIVADPDAPFVHAAFELLASAIRVTVEPGSLKAPFRRFR